MKAVAIAGALIVFFMGVAVFGDHGLIGLAKSNRELVMIEEEAEELEMENLRLREEIDRLRNDLTLVEQVAREDLGMVKKGELVIQFHESSSGVVSERP